MPNVPSEILEKQPFSRDSIACGCSQENSVEKTNSRHEKHHDSEVVVLVVLLLPADVLVAAPTAAVVLLQSNSFQSSVGVGVGVGQPLCPDALPLASAGVGGYRVCISCDTKKECFVCHSKQTNDHFCASAWMAREPKRRVCLQCQTKTRGSWKCAACHQRKPQQQFSDFIGKRPSGEDGTQTCNACRTVVAQAVLRKRAAASSISRLEPLRKTLRRTQMLRETWEAIAKHRKKRTSQTMTSEKEATNEIAIPTEIEQSPPPEKIYVYSCPFCQKSITTSIASGQVNHRRACGKQFRVQDGVLRPTLPTTHFSHTCPTCGTCVQSTKEFGRIKSKHKQSNGRVCRRTEWHAK